MQNANAVYRTCSSTSYTSNHRLMCVVCKNHDHPSFQPASDPSHTHAPRIVFAFRYSKFLHHVRRDTLAPGTIGTHTHTV